MRGAVSWGKRLLGLAGSLLVLSAAVFWAAHLAPTDPLAALYGERAERLTAEERTEIQERLGLNDPLPRQYLRWLSGALRGDFGVSYQYKTDVLDLIRGRIGSTLLLGGGAFLLIFFLAPLLGLVCVRYEGRWPDRLLCRLGTAAGCVPEFWLSLLLIWLFSVTLGLLPGGGAVSAGGEGRLAHLILPMAAAVLSHLGYYAYLARGLLLAQAREDYALLARARGLSQWAVLARHCLRPAAPAYLGAMALAAPHILGGSYVVEAVFAYPGLGALAYESARYRDVNLLMALCLLSGALAMLCGMGARALGGLLGGDREERGGEAHGG